MLIIYYLFHLKKLIEFYLGYINEGGKLNLPRLESYLETLGQFDKEFFNERYDDLKFLETKHNQGYVCSVIAYLTICSVVHTFFLE